MSRLVLYDKIGPGPHPCHWCGRPINWAVGITADGLLVDHLDWDRMNDAAENLVPSCNNCNTRRAAPGRRGAITSDEATVLVGGLPTRAVECACGTCSKVFLTVKSRPGRYCSRPCYYKSLSGRSRPRRKVT